MSKEKSSSEHSHSKQADNLTQSKALFVTVGKVPELLYNFHLFINYSLCSVRIKQKLKTYADVDILRALDVFRPFWV